MFIDKCTQPDVILQASDENNVVLQAFHKITKTDIQILFHIFNYHNIYTAIFFARKTIASKIGISVKQFTRRTNFLRDLGFLLKKRPDGKPFDVCTYKLTDMAIELKGRVLYWYNYYKRMGFALGISLLLSPNPAARSDVPLYCLKDNSYTKTTDEQPEHLFLKVYSIYSEAQKRREYPPAHHWPTENRESRRMRKTSNEERE